MNILSDFGVQPILLAAQVVNFLVLLFILQRFLYRPILKVLKDRKQTIETSLKQAEEIELRLQQTEEEREQIVSKAAQEAQHIVDEAAKTANQIVEEAHQKAMTDINAMIERNNQAMKTEREQLRQEVRQDAAHLVTVALQKITGKVLTKSDQKNIIDQSVKGL